MFTKSVRARAMLTAIVIAAAGLGHTAYADDPLPPPPTSLPPGCNISFVDKFDDVECSKNLGAIADNYEDWVQNQLLGASPRQNAGSCHAAAVRIAGTLPRVNFACLADLVTVRMNSTTGGLPTVLVGAISGSGHVDVTDVAEQAREDAVQQLLTQSPRDNTVQSEFRGTSQDEIIYGVQENGRIIFSSSVRVRTIIGLQARSHFFEVSWAESSRRQIGFTIPARMRKDRGGRPDETTDSTSYNNEVASSSYRASQFLDTTSSGKFFANLYNMKINDRQYGTFEVQGDIQSPRFRCTSDSGENCKFPNGMEA
jgi:hypothetical protein